MGCKAIAEAVALANPHRQNLAGTRTIGLVYKRDDKAPTIQGYVDASFADSNDCKSTAGWALMIKGALTAFDSTTIKRVVTSSTEAECHAMTVIGKENTWQRRLCGELIGELKEPTPIKCDNSAAIAMLSAGVTKRSRHYAIEWFKMQDLIEQRELVVDWVCTEDNLADFFTKKLPRQRFVELRDKLMGDATMQEYFTPPAPIVSCIYVDDTPCDIFCSYNHPWLDSESDTPEWLKEDEADSTEESEDDWPVEWLADDEAESKSDGPIQVNMVVDDSSEDATTPDEMPPIPMTLAMRLRDYFPNIDFTVKGKVFVQRHKGPGSTRVAHPPEHVRDFVISYLATVDSINTDPTCWLRNTEDGALHMTLGCGRMATKFCRAHRSKCISFQKVRKNGPLPRIGVVGCGCTSLIAANPVMLADNGPMVAVDASIRVW